MDQLSVYGVHLGLSKQEFIYQLTCHPASSLRELRTLLIEDAERKGYIPVDLHGLPLVQRRDSALRPVTNALSEDIWTISQSIANRIHVPRVLFKHGKRSKGYIQSLPRVNSNCSQPIPQCTSSHDGNNISCSQPCPESIRIQSQKETPKTTGLPHSTPPNSFKVSSFLINRELNRVKDELRIIKSDIASFRRQPSLSLPSTVQAELGHEIKNLRDEIVIIRNQLSALSTTGAVSSPSSQHCTEPNLSDTKLQKLCITSWNCRGIMTASPYLYQLIEEGSDIIAVSEHWLWPYQLCHLNNIHPDFVGFGFSDNRLHEESPLSRGCGGVGFIWRRSLNITPIHSVISDRFCVIQLELSQCKPCLLSIISVYLPSSDHSLDEYTGYLSELENTISTLKSSGPVMLVGDFNAHIPEVCGTGNKQGELLLQTIHSHDLFVASTSSLSNGPNYTFFAGMNKTTVDYIITDVSLAPTLLDCKVHNHHPLNLSDHLPISLSLQLNSLLIPTSPTKHPRINWPKSIEGVGINAYVQEIASAVSPLLPTTLTSTSALNTEIAHVCEVIHQAALNHLTTYSGNRKSKAHFCDEELKRLCKNSKVNWKAWCQAGRPLSGRLYEEKQAAKKLVRKRVVFLRARKERAEIQKRDEMFKNNHHLRFKSPSKVDVCRRLLVDGSMITDPSDILDQF